MKQKFLMVALLAAITSFAAGCAPDNPQPDVKTAMQKEYNSLADCSKDFPVAGDCTRVTGGNLVPGSGGAHAGSGGFVFMSPYFYPWGGIIHSNGSTTYNNRVPTSGYHAAANSSRLAAVSKSVNYANVPRSYTSAGRASSVRGGFGGSARGSSGG